MLLQRLGAEVTIGGNRISTTTDSVIESVAYQVVSPLWVDKILARCLIKGNKMVG